MRPRPLRCPRLRPRTRGCVRTTPSAEPAPCRSGEYRSGPPSRAMTRSPSPGWSAPPACGRTAIEPKTRMNDSATCTATSAWPRLRRPPPLTMPRALSRSASAGVSDVPRKAGATPNNRPVRTPTPVVNANTRQSIARLTSTTWVLVESMPTIARAPQAAITSPAAGADERQHDAFDQQLPDQLPAARAQRQPYRELAPPRHRLCEQQIGHVGAGDRQHESDNAEQHEQRTANSASRRLEMPVAARRQDHRLADVLGLILRPLILRHRGLTQLRLEGAQPSLAFGERLSGRQAGDDRQPPVAAAIERAFRAADDRLGAERRRHVERAPDLDAAKISSATRR